MHPELSSCSSPKPVPFAQLVMHRPWALSHPDPLAGLGPALLTHLLTAHLALPHPPLPPPHTAGVVQLHPKPSLGPPPRTPTCRLAVSAALAPAVPQSCQEGRPQPQGLCTYVLFTQPGSSSPRCRHEVSMTAHLEGPLLCQPLLCTSLKGQALCPPPANTAPAPAAGGELWEAPAEGLLCTGSSGGSTENKVEPACGQDGC